MPMLSARVHPAFIQSRCTQTALQSLALLICSMSDIVIAIHPDAGSERTTIDIPKCLQSLQSNACSTNEFGRSALAAL